MNFVFVLCCEVRCTFRVTFTRGTLKGGCVIVIHRITLLICFVDGIYAHHTVTTFNSTFTFRNTMGICILSITKCFNRYVVNCSGFSKYQNSYQWSTKSLVGSSWLHSQCPQPPAVACTWNLSLWPTDWRPLSVQCSQCSAEILRCSLKSLIFKHNALIIHVPKSRSLSASTIQHRVRPVTTVVMTSLHCSQAVVRTLIEVKESCC